MRQPIKLNESDITRIVRRVISENVKGEKFLKAVDVDNDGDYDDWDGTDEKAIENVIRSIKSTDEYNEINSYVTKKTGKGVTTWIRMEREESENYYMFCHLVSLGVTVNGYSKHFCNLGTISCVDRMTRPNPKGNFGSHANRYGNIKYINGSYDLYQGSDFFCRIK